MCTPPSETSTFRISMQSPDPHVLLASPGAPLSVHTAPRECSVAVQSGDPQEPPCPGRAQGELPDGVKGLDAVSDRERPSESRT